MEQAGRIPSKGDHVRITKHGRATRRYCVRLTKDAETVTSHSGRVYLSLVGYRIKPDELNVSFGDLHGYLVLPADCELLP